MFGYCWYFVYNKFLSACSMPFAGSIERRSIGVFISVLLFLLSKRYCFCWSSVRMRKCQPFLVDHSTNYSEFINSHSTNGFRFSDGPSTIIFCNDSRCWFIHFGWLWFMRWIPLPWQQHQNECSTNRWMARSSHVDIDLCCWHCVMDIAFITFGRSCCLCGKCKYLFVILRRFISAGNLWICVFRIHQRPIARISWAPFLELCPAPKLYHPNHQESRRTNPKFCIWLSGSMFSRWPSPSCSVGSTSFPAPDR